jgi:hypothetical protein
LTTLNLALNGHITDAGIGNLVRHCRRLVHVDVGFCFRLTDVALVALSSLPLASLAMCHLEHVTNSGVAAIVETVPTLRVLNASGCQRLTPGLLSVFPRSSVSRVHLMHTNIRNEELSQVARSNPAITFIY